MYLGSVLPSVASVSITTSFTTATETSAASRALVFVWKGTRGGVCVVFANFSNLPISFSKFRTNPQNLTLTHTYNN